MLQQLSRLHIISCVIIIVIAVVEVVIVPREVAAIVVFVGLECFVAELSVAVVVMKQKVMAAI